MNIKNKLIKKIRSIVLNYYFSLLIFNQFNFATAYANIGATAKNSIDQPLFSAVLNGYFQDVEQLINNGADVNSLNKEDATVLFLAVDCGHLAIVRLLLEKGASVNVNNARKLPLNKFVAPIFSFKLISRYNGNGFVHGPLKEVNTDMDPLSLAIQKNQIEIVRLLLDHNAKLSDILLERAVKRSQIEIVRLLLEKGADVKYTEYVVSGKQTLLHLTIERNQIEMLQLLLEKGADANTIDDNKNTLLHLAAKNGHLEIVRLLLETGVDVNLGNSAFFVAVEGGHLEIASLLLAKGADVLNHHNDITFDRAVKNYRIAVSRVLELLLWYGYQTSILQLNNYESPFSQSIEHLIRLIETVNGTSTTVLINHVSVVYEAEYLDQVKSLARWIVAEILNCQSKKEFLEKILKRLLEPSFDEQTLLKQSVKHLLLSKYLLNPDSSDFYELKSKLSNKQLEKLKELEGFLRYTYAEQLKKEFFGNLSQKDLKKALNALEKQKHRFTVLDAITNLHKINKPIMKYCRDASIQSRSPFVSNIFQADKTSRINELAHWIQQQQDNSSESSTQEVFPKKEPSAREIWSNWGKLYLEDSKQLIRNIYNHLEYIIKQQGAQLNSNTRFGRDRIIDILKFEK